VIFELSKKTYFSMYRLPRLTLWRIWSLLRNGSQIDGTLLREMWAFAKQRLKLAFFRYNEQRPNCSNSQVTARWIIIVAATDVNRSYSHDNHLTNRQKITLGQGVLAPVREVLLNRVDFDRKSRSKEPIRDATSGADQRSQVRAATKKPAIRRPTKIKDQHGSEERTL
jgi:hypothetical protein